MTAKRQGTRYCRSEKRDRFGSFLVADYITFGDGLSPPWGSTTSTTNRQSTKNHFQLVAAGSFYLIQLDHMNEWNHTGTSESILNHSLWFMKLRG